MKIIKKFKNYELLTFAKNKKIKILIDDNYEKFSIKKGYKINLINSNKGSYKGSFMNNYICKKFKSNQKVNLTNIETNKILNYCKYFLLSQKEYFNYSLKNTNYQYFWFLRSPYCSSTDRFLDISTHYFACVYDGGGVVGNETNRSCGFIPFFYKKEG